MKPDIAELAEQLQSAISMFVRAVRLETGTPRTAKSDTLELLERDGALNVASLAQLRSVKHQSMRLVAYQLEADGLVQREADSTDRRSQLLVMTEAGRDWLHQARKRRTEHIGEMIESRFSSDEFGELHAAAQLLHRLMASSHPLD